MSRFCRRGAFTILGPGSPLSSLPGTSPGRSGGALLPGPRACRGRSGAAPGPARQAARGLGGDRRLARVVPNGLSAPQLAQSHGGLGLLFQLACAPGGARKRPRCDGRKAPRRHRPAWAWRRARGGGSSRPGWGRRRTAGWRRLRPPAPGGGGRRRGAGSAAGAGERPGRRAGGRARALPALSVPCALPRPAALYCMNEAELLEVALAVLAENLQCEEGEKKARSRSEEEQEIPPTPEEVPGSTANTHGGSDHGPALPSPPGAGAGAQGIGGENSEDDVLKYVREIFFS
ncbi:cell cycle regulator of non-homologous end joining [Serinus canaria]|uniref:cell cycle regulator of non-homologous end joining n=1 Tax=Serinus canaria TaxID=9135 RepID=UPI0021CCAD63|nr:cell cycle regulator of non-homologous end joining [Serinus canaria]